MPDSVFQEVVSFDLTYEFPSVCMLDGMDEVKAWYIYVFVLILSNQAF